MTAVELSHDEVLLLRSALASYQLHTATGRHADIDALHARLIRLWLAAPDARHASDPTT